MTKLEMILNFSLIDRCRDQACGREEKCEVPHVTFGKRVISRSDASSVMLFQ